MPLVFLSLGSNIGDRKSNIKKAIELLKDEGIKIGRLSKIIETKPQGGPPQPKFLNAVISIRTELPPRGLLKTIKRIEKKMGRFKGVRFGPRVIDLDILLYGDLKLKSKQLEIPHPRMWERQFVLRPLYSLISPSKLKKIRGI
jgi:2-amino-4-hydroxy-6-hydroxymethyldihydropteridine diphosphokinase